MAASAVMGTTFVPMTDEDLLQQSPLVVTGRVTAVSPGPLDAPPSTDYTVRVERVLRGEDPGSRVTVRVLGGVRADGRGLRISGAPRFAEGGSVLLFLRPRSDGAARIVQFHIGAFHVVELDERHLAVRDMGESVQMPAISDRQRTAAETFHRPRDVERFGAWVADRTAGIERPADYLVDLDAKSRLRLAEKFTFLRWEETGFPTRWFLFDDPGVVRWHFDADGYAEADLAGGGRNELRRALDIWEQEPRTPIDFTFAGNSAATLGLTEFDDLNVVLLEDPNDEVDGTFSCVRGGVAAIGGPWFTESHFAYRGERYHLIGGGDIVVNDGVRCFAITEAQPSLSYEELFTHELGHTLGLGHSCGDDDGSSPPCFGNALLDDAVMRAQLHGGGRGGRLNGDDLAGIRLLYEGGESFGGPRPAAPSNLLARVEARSIRLAWQDNSSSEGGFEIERGVDGAGFARIAQLPANAIQFLDADPPIGVTHTYRVRATSAGGPSAYSQPASATVLTSTDCEPSELQLCTLDDRFLLSMSWADGGGAVGPGHVVPVDSANSGLFWFFNSTNWEVLVKVLDGCVVNQHFWVFAAATTDVAYTLRVIELESGITTVYTNPLGVQSPAITDTAAFATCP
jgi:hypothetical protein